MVCLHKLPSAGIRELGEIERSGLELRTRTELGSLNLPASDPVELFSSTLDDLIRQTLLRHTPPLDNPGIERHCSSYSDAKEDRKQRQPYQRACAEYCHAQTKRNRDQTQVIEAPSQARYESSENG